MLHCLRILVIALLLPAYCLAAVGVGKTLPYSAGADSVLIEGHTNPEHLGDDRAANVDDLFLELGDTSDDLAEVLTPNWACLPTSFLPQAVPAGAAEQATGRTPDKLLRPPIAAAPRA
jgi:hypothetical protein